jgi:hypothetical protein
VLNMKPRQQTYNEDLIVNENEIHGQSELFHHV